MATGQKEAEVILYMQLVNGTGLLESQSHNNFVYENQKRKMLISCR